MIQHWQCSIPGPGPRVRKNLGRGWEDAAARVEPFLQSWFCTLRWVIPYPKMSHNYLSRNTNLLLQRSRKRQICVVGMCRNWRRKGDSRPGLAGAQCCKNQAYFNFFSPFLPTPASHETILKQSLTFVLCSTTQCPTMPAMQW